MMVKPAKFTEFELGNKLTSEEFVKMFVEKFFGFESFTFDVEFFKILLSKILERWSERERRKISGKDKFRRYLKFTNKYIPQNDELIIDETIQKILKDKNKTFYYVQRAIDDILFGEQFYFCDICGGLEGNYCMMQFILYYYLKEKR